MAIDIDTIYSNTYKSYEDAKNNIQKRDIVEHSFSAISDVIPGFDADKLEFGSYDKENFARCRLSDGSGNICFTSI